MAAWIIVALLLFIAVTLYIGLHSLLKIEQSLTTFTAKAQESLDHYESDRRELRDRLAESETDGMTEWLREKQEGKR